MKRRSGILFIAVICMLSIGCSSLARENSQARVDYGSMDLAHIYETLDELTDASNVVAEIHLTNRIETITYEGASFTLTSAKIKEAIKGAESLANKDIKLFEVESFNMNQTNKDGRYILFLSKYDGPVVTGQDVYTITGVYQGRFSIDGNNNVIYDAAKYNGEVTFQETVEHLSAEEFKKSIKEKAIN